MNPHSAGGGLDALKTFETQTWRTLWQRFYRSETTSRIKKITTRHAHWRFLLWRENWCFLSETTKKRRKKATNEKTWETSILDFLKTLGRRELKLWQSHFLSQGLLWSEFQHPTTLHWSNIEFPQPASWEKNRRKNQNIEPERLAFATQWHCVNTKLLIFLLFSERLLLFQRRQVV